MKSTYDNWLNRKLEAEPFVPVREWVISKQWKKMTGRELFGAVTLRIAPSSQFVFEDKCVWPKDRERFSQSVLDEILDALLIDLRAAPGRACFTLEAIEWRDEASVPRGYEEAAREAVIEAFGLNEKARFGAARGHAV